LGALQCSNPSVKQNSVNNANNQLNKLHNP
jgi:hypothetical protein